MASAVQGILVDGAARPVSGVTVTRRWNWGWNGRSGTESAVTDRGGRFAFAPVVVSSGLTGLLPHAPGVGLEFTAELETGPLLLLDMKKRNYDPDGELEGQPLCLRCRTDLVPEARGFFWGTCDLDSTFDLTQNPILT